MNEHYKHGDVQPIDLITSQQMNFLEGNIIKYVCRYKYKDGLKDLIKAENYLKLLKSNVYYQELNKEGVNEK